MCVIFVCEKVRPTPEMVKSAWASNSHGGGVAWRDLNEKEEGVVKEVVKWEKGLTLEEMQTYCAELPFPFVAHFRVASSGGPRPELCHPFEVDQAPSKGLSGHTYGAVLFHNGDWPNWRDMVLHAALQKGVPIPDGHFSDSKAMGWLCSLYGKNLMNMIKQKGVIFSTTEVQYYLANGWKDINGVWCSNHFFWGGVRVTGMCKAHSCNETRYLDEDRYCIRCAKKVPVDPTDPTTWEHKKEGGHEGEGDDEVSHTSVVKALVKYQEDQKAPQQQRVYDRTPSTPQTRGVLGKKNPFPLAIQPLIEAGNSEQALMVAENMFDLKKLGKKAIKRIRIAIRGDAHYPYSAQSLKDSQKAPDSKQRTDSSTIPPLSPQGTIMGPRLVKKELRDPRIETITIH